jgi:hypothetical protein
MENPEHGTEMCGECEPGQAFVHTLLNTPGVKLYGHAQCQVRNHGSHHVDLVVTFPRSQLDSCTSELLERYGLRVLSRDEEVRLEGGTTRIVAAFAAGATLFGLCPYMAYRHKEALLSHGFSVFRNLFSSGVYLGSQIFSPKGDVLGTKEPDHKDQGQ